MGGSAALECSKSGSKRWFENHDEEIQCSKPIEKDQGLFIGTLGGKFSGLSNKNKIARLSRDKKKRQKNDIVRIGAKMFMFIYSGMMIRGKMALESLFCSMLSIK